MEDYLEHYWLLRKWTGECWIDCGEVKTDEEARIWQKASDTHSVMRKKKVIIGNQQQQTNWEPLRLLTEAYHYFKRTEQTLVKAKQDLADAEAAYTTWKEQQRKQQ